MQQRRLGRGLDSLLEIGQELNSSVLVEKGLSVTEINLDKVFPNPDQPRKEFDQGALEELASSIREKGVIQPILVSGRPDDRYMIIAGERRYRASKLAGKTTIPAIICDYSIEDIMEIALIENLQREDLNPMEEAIAFKNLAERFNLSQEQIAQKIGKNRSTIANSLRLLKLPETVQTGISQNKISAGHARALLSLKSPVETLQAMYEKMVERGFSVREAEMIAQNINAGSTVENAIEQIGGTSIDNDSQTENSEYATQKNALQLSQGATIKLHEAESKIPATKRPSELWDMEEKLILSLGTKVQIKGDLKTGKIEIAYFSLDDLERLYDLISKP